MNSPLQPSRRALLQSAAWTVPAITLATAAPAFASSFNQCLVHHSFDFTPFLDKNAPGHPQPVRNGVTGVPDPAKATWAVASTVKGSDQAKAAGAIYASSIMTVSTTVKVGRFRDSDSLNGSTPNGHFRFTTLGQTTEVSGNDPSSAMIAKGPALKFATDTLSTAKDVFPEMEIVITFDTAVQELSFLLTDIDSNGDSQLDKVWIEEISFYGAPVAYKPTRPTPTNKQAVSFSNTAGTSLATAWTGTASVKDTQNWGNLLVTTPAGVQVSKVVIGFANHSTNTTARNNTINLANVSYKTEQKACA